MDGRIRVPRPVAGTRTAVQALEAVVIAAHAEPLPAIGGGRLALPDRLDVRYVASPSSQAPDLQRSEAALQALLASVRAGIEALGGAFGVSAEMSVKLLDPGCEAMLAATGYRRLESSARTRQPPALQTWYRFGFRDQRCAAAAIAGVLSVRARVHASAVFDAAKLVVHLTSRTAHRCSLRVDDDAYPEVCRLRAQAAFERRVRAELRRVRRELTCRAYPAAMLWPGREVPPDGGGLSVAFEFFSKPYRLLLPPATRPPGRRPD